MSEEAKKVKKPVITEELKNEFKGLIKKMDDVDRMKGQSSMYSASLKSLKNSIEKFTDKIAEKLHGTKEGNAKLMEFLRVLKGRDKLSRKTYYLLNELEQAVADGRCVYRPTCPARGDLQFCKVDEEYPFKREFETSKGAYVYKVYVNREVTAKEQLTDDQYEQLKAGVPIHKVEGLKEAKTQWYEVSLLEREFNKHFESSVDLDNLEELFA